MTALTHKPARALDPFDIMRANRLLAPHDPKLNDIRWLIGEALRRAHQRARLSSTQRLQSVAEGVAQARDRIRQAEELIGPHAWPIVTRIVIEGAGVRDCRGFVPELATPWRADAIVTDRLRTALDMIGGVMGVTPQ